ncbi:MAG: hypothetical protein QM534_12290 [Sediminibacterium sp.]|nr:hypothetical protein [Sediminibacterium sp.]
MSEDDLLFEERQYMGHNRFSMMVRTVLALFCFMAYYWSENPKPVELTFFKIGSYPIQHISHSGTIFFLMGLLILLLSVALTYVLHIHTKVYKNYIVIDGFGTARRVKIDLGTITHIRKSRYKKNGFRRAVYNLHNKGIIKFYTSGSDFVELSDNSGFVYRIGSQKAVELCRLLKARKEYMAL